MEYAMFDEFVDVARKRNVENIYGHYVKTAKNKLVSQLYQDLGFVLTSGDEDETFWKFSIPETYENKNKCIGVKK